ncbi:MAG: HAD family hydrolase [Bacillus sp. (in: Bacteria)]|nr:HAD family hydrolase [Bacillus sp. (in: firmicutes)]
MKLISFNLDETLHSSEGDFTEYTTEVLKAIKEAGHKIVLTTERHPLLTLPIVNNLEGCDAIVCANGAYIRTLDNPIPVTATYSIFNVMGVSQFLLELGCKFVVVTEKTMYLHALLAKHREYFQHLPISIKLVSSLQEIQEPILKTSVIGTEYELMELEDMLTSVVRELSVVRNREGSLDILHPNASKGRGLAILGDYYSINRSDIITLRDYYNYMDLLAYAQVGVASK